MKKILIAALAAISFAACSPKPAEAPAKKGNGYTDIETEHVNTVKKLNEASVAYDSAATRAFYSGTQDTIHNNLENLTLDQNLAMLADLKKRGITATIDAYPAIWETVNDSANAKGVTNFVIAYMTMTLKKGDKTAKVLFNQICAFNKEGKIVEEWDVYDSKPFFDIAQ